MKKQLFELSEDFDICKAELNEVHDSTERQITITPIGTGALPEVLKCLKLSLAEDRKQFTTLHF